MLRERSTQPSWQLTSLAAVALVLVAPVAIADGTGREQQAETEIFRGVLVAMGTVGTGANTSLNVHITDWTTPTQRQVLLNALRSNATGESSLFNLLRSQPEKGFLQVRSVRGTTRLKYAWQTEQDGKRMITVIADDLLPALFSGGRNYSDRQFTIVHLEVDEEGNGTGSAALSASISYDEETNRIKIGIESTEPIRITSVRKVQ